MHHHFSFNMTINNRGNLSESDVSKATPSKPKFSLPLQLVPTLQQAVSANTNASPVPDADTKGGSQETGGTDVPVDVEPIESISKPVEAAKHADAGVHQLAMSEIELQNLFETAQPLDPMSFPNPPRKPAAPIPPTYPNVEFLLGSYGVAARYDEIKKKIQVTIPHYVGSPDNIDAAALTLIVSLGNLNRMSTGQIPSLVAVVADKNRFSPVRDWIESKPWDGINRLPAFFDTLVAHRGFPVAFKNVLMYRWALSAVAAALMPSGFHSRGVLTLQGEQELGKSAWVKSLVSDQVLCADVVLENHHLDPSNKDTLIAAARHWIVEFGEVDSMFKKDVARIKGFVTAGQDKVRVPYARVESEFQRRTVFVATVNDTHFLVDKTGNTRWWVIPVIKVDYQHEVDMQQVFAQLAVDFRNGAQWWLTKEESADLEMQNREYRAVSALRERLMDVVDMTLAGSDNLPALTPTEVLLAIGIGNPTNTQCKEAADILRELFGESKRINGRDKWRVPVRYMQRAAPTPAVDDANEY